jgi:hypothetical protein
MSLPIIFRPIARLEMDDAMGWHRKQKVGLEAEFKDAVDQMLDRCRAAPASTDPQSENRPPTHPCFSSLPFCGHPTLTPPSTPALCPLVSDIPFQLPQIQVFDASPSPDGPA